MNAKTAGLMLMASALLWIVWGVVHAAAGALIMGGDTLSGFQACWLSTPPTAG